MTPTDPLLIVPLSRRIKFSAQKCETILDQYLHFLLAATPNDYLPGYMKATGYRVDPVFPNATQPVIFEVKASKDE
jgi:hypothetical protein